MSNITVGCIIVTYNPVEQRFNTVINSILKQCDKVVIIDNKSLNVDYVEETSKENCKIQLRL